MVGGFLAEGCTVMAPTFSWSFAVPAPGHLRFPRNASECDAFEEPKLGIGRIYTPDTLEIDKAEMGAIPAFIVTMPGRVRGNHPLCSFSAVGPRARELVAGQAPLDVYAPLEALVEVNGWIVLVGVGLEKLTFLHLAEKAAGRNLFRRWANGIDGQVLTVEAGGCSGGFRKFSPSLRHLTVNRKVGKSRWRVFPAQAALQAAVEAIRQDPRITHCGHPQCERCNDAVRGGPILDGRINEV